MVFLAVAVPDQHRQEVGHLRISGIEMHHRIQNVRLAHAAVADGHREQRAGMQQRAGHGEMLALAERTGGREQTGNGAGQVAKQAMLLAEALAQLINCLDPHLFQRAVEEHRGIETGCVVADLGDDIGMAQHDQRGIGLGAGGESAGVAGRLRAADLQGQIAQCVGREQRLIGGGG